MNRAELALRSNKVLAAIEDGIGWLTLNNPQRHNALSLDMWEAIEQAAAAFAQDESVRVVVVSGAGGKAFASGADISEFEKLRANAQQKAEYGAIAAKGHQAVAQLEKPLLAMIDGYCVGGGLALALAADLRIASATSRLGIPAARLGLGYEHEGLAVLARLVGPSAAKDLMYSARLVQADEAWQMGLVNRVVDPAQLEATVREYALGVARNAPLTVKAAKAALQLFEGGAGAPDAAQVRRMVEQCFDSEDYREGRRAFMEKRMPQFKGR
jgi:enoyl-CoA hydratase